MRRVATVLGTAAVVMFVAGVYAQGKDFSGTWTQDAEKTTAANPAPPAGGGGGGGGRGGAGGGGGRGGGGPMTVAMDAKTMKVTTMGQNGEQVATYNLDGTVTKVQARGGEADAKATWEGNKLKIATTSQGQNGPQTTTVVYYMDGAWLVREQEIAARGDVPASTRKTYFKKG